MGVEVIDITGLVTMTQDGTPYVRLADHKGQIHKDCDRISGGEFLQSLENTINELNQGNIIYGDGSLNPGDRFTLHLTILRRNIPNE